jgi:hypothetical protein
VEDRKGRRFRLRTALSKGVRKWGCFLTWLAKISQKVGKVGMTGNFEALPIGLPGGSALRLADSLLTSGVCPSETFRDQVNSIGPEWAADLPGPVPTLSIVGGDLRKVFQKD